MGVFTFQKFWNILGYMVENENTKIYIQWYIDRINHIQTYT